MSDLNGRATALSPTEILRLDMWASTLVGLGDYPPCLVGSVLRRRDFRDVDVRLMVDDEDPILANPDRLRAINVAMSVWAQQVTGLPVDFQFQSRSAHAAEDGPMNPLGHLWRTTDNDASTGADTDGNIGRSSELGGER